MTDCSIDLIDDCIHEKKQKKKYGEIRRRYERRKQNKKKIYKLEPSVPGKVAGYRLRHKYTTFCPQLSSQSSAVCQQIVPPFFNRYSGLIGSPILRKQIICTFAGIKMMKRIDRRMFIVDFQCKKCQEIKLKYHDIQSLFIFDEIFKICVEKKIK